ncbi:hypothetical protein HYPSUDRAFT_61367 [Hypholoma sublateritium FD-334 SS-4]|uniref:Dihydroorotate oxidase n=1 Tax=Hypholoma sublateritium (strain FD-334 SS-4) TaxID=945553 RepID=A0A0D2PF03_HYPSF|nr:hypothetical protein HYPSUDRAFT_61367 [Hypholoma sublateritium FD-334 SS-4]
MVIVNTIDINPLLLNSSCAWSSDLHQLTELYDAPYTGAVTTRTATLAGFPEDDAIHTVAFAADALTTINSYGYSPHPLEQYLIWVEAILAAHAQSTKPIIISITASDPTTLHGMLAAIQDLRARLGDATSAPSRIAVELNTSCPNIPGAPPSGYTFSSLQPLLRVLAAAHAGDPTLTLGLKLPPYTFRAQFADALAGLRALDAPCPIAFLTCTNTLGNALLFADEAGAFAVPTAVGGVAGDSLHALALGNVYTFRQLLATADARDAGLGGIKIIGVGGVTSRAAAARMMQAGADVVACATLFGKEGVRAFEILGKE